MRFTQTPDGKNVFLSVDSRVTRKNPFYKAWKAKSFTDGDITLHFAIFDILYELGERMRPNYLTEYFPKYIAKHGMPKMRFHDLRHPYVKHTTKNKSLQKQKSQAIKEF